MGKWFNFGDRGKKTHHTWTNIYSKEKEKQLTLLSTHSAMGNRKIYTGKSKAQTKQQIIDF